MSQDERIGTALFGGVVAAIVGAISWSLVVAWTEYEASWFAVGVGALVGFTMSRMTPARGMMLGVVAALLATAGLAGGKYLSLRSAYAPVVREAVLEDQQAMTVAFAFDMFRRDAYSPELQQELYRYPEPDSVPPHLVEVMLEEATERLETAPLAERQRVVRALVDSALGRATFTQQFTAVLGLWDIIWSLAAIGAAWKIMAAE